MSQEFLGAGWKFPPTLEQGKMALSYYEEDITEAISIILSTAPGERLMHPDFGCGIHDFVFASNNTRTSGLIRFHVEQALNRWEPRITLLEVDVQSDPYEPALLRISIDYRVNVTDSLHNLVYPFYLDRGESL